MEKKKVIIAASAGIALGVLFYGLFRRRKEIKSLVEELRPVTKREVIRRVEELSDDGQQFQADKAAIKKIVDSLFVDKEKFLKQPAVPHQMKKDFLVSRAIEMLTQ